MSRIIPKSESDISEAEFRETVIRIIVLFCASGTGIYGSSVSGMTGDQSILDFFTAIIFACLLGAVVSFIAIPQFMIFMILFFLDGVIYPLTTPDMIPAMVLAMPGSYIWSTYIMPLVS